MGFDTSYHPVDVALIQGRLFPYLRGEGSIDDLVDRAVRLAKVRFRANAWGLGLLALEQAASAAPRGGKKKKKLIEVEPPPQTAPVVAVPAAFDAQLHVWGRPFFITATDPADVVAAVDRYLAATPEQVDDIAREMLARLDPNLVAHVQPSTEGSLPDDRLARGLRWKMDLFRTAYAAYHADKTVEGPEGEPFEPAELFAGDFPLAVLEFASHFTPGWMTRGYVWPTHLLSEAGLDCSMFDDCGELFEPLREAIPEVAAACEATITANYQVGGFVRAEAVPALAEVLESGRGRMIEQFRVEYGWGDDGGADLRKLLEAVTYARSHGFAFAEATEIYSGFSGVMN